MTTESEKKELFKPLWMPEETPTVSALIRQGFGYASMCWDNPDAAGNFRSDLVLRASDVVIKELGALLTGRLASLLDPTGVASEWNEAVEKCIATIEEMH